MTLFVDASVLVAIIAGEPDADTLSDRIERDSVRITSALALWETARAIAKASDTGIGTAWQQCERLRTSFDIVVVSTGAQEAEIAVDAHRRYGKGTGHPAKLNMGDCFTYACAKTNGAKLLYKGNDFAHTDAA